MPKKTVASTPSLYRDLRIDSRSLQENNDCAVIALAAVANVSYSDAHKALAAQGRKNGKGTYVYQTERALAMFGKRLKRINIKDYIFTNYPNHFKRIPNITTHHPRRFKKAFNPSKRYLFRTERHILAVVNGEVNDWTINRSMYVTELYEVI